MIFGRLKMALGAALAGLLAVAGAWMAGKREGRQKAAQAQQKAKADTFERIVKDADVGSGDTDADRDWLRKRGESGRDL